MNMNNYENSKLKARTKYEGKRRNKTVSFNIKTEKTC